MMSKEKFFSKTDQPGEVEMCVLSSTFVICAYHFKNQIIQQLRKTEKLCGIKSWKPRDNSASLRVKRDESQSFA